MLLKIKSNMLQNVLMMYQIIRKKKLAETRNDPISLACLGFLPISMFSHHISHYDITKWLSFISGTIYYTEHAWIWLKVQFCLSTIRLSLHWNDSCCLVDIHWGMWNHRYWYTKEYQRQYNTNNMLHAWWDPTSTFNFYD